MKQLICSLTLLLVTSIGALGQDLSGRYQATLDLGHDNQQAVLIIVEVEGSAVSGSIGPDEKHRIFQGRLNPREHNLVQRWRN